MRKFASRINKTANKAGPMDSKSPVKKRTEYRISKNFVSLMGKLNLKWKYLLITNVLINISIMANP